MTTAGWYPDPTDERVMRYWNGVEWTSERALNAPTPTASAPQAPTRQFPMTKTSWFLFGGAAVAAIGVFMPWEHDTTAVGSISRGPTSAAGGAALLLVLLGLIVWAAFPSRTQSLSTARQITVAALTACLGFFVIAKFAALAHASTQAHAQSADAANSLFPGLVSATDISYGPGVGLFVYAAGVVGITIGVVRAWFSRARGVAA